MCLQPVILKKGVNLYQPVPCGKCAQCMERYRNDWIIRIKAEVKAYRFSYFVTLTYKDENLTYGSWRATLVKSDFQKYLKRIRKAGNSCKYFCVGEYGTKYLRPHYHMIYMTNDEDMYMQKNGKVKINEFEKHWKLGRVQVAEVNDKVIGYVCKYHALRTVFPRGSEPSFSLASKGIGMSYVEKHKNWHLQSVETKDFIYLNGFKKPLPRYMKGKIYSEEDRLKLAAKNEKLIGDKALIDAKNDIEAWKVDKNHFLNKKYANEYRTLAFFCIYISSSFVMYII